MAQVVRERGGAVAYREAKTLDRKQAANASMARIAGELAEPVLSSSSGRRALTSHCAASYVD